MASEIARRETATPTPRLQRFDPAWAELVAKWIVDAREAYWLAPKTPPPVTPDQIRRWKLPGHEPLQLVAAELDEPVAYGELNVLSRQQGHYWLGHLLVAPARRGQGIGCAFARLLLERAFFRCGALRVSLVVFPENEPALRCYRAAGMRDAGYEEHELPAYGRRVSLVRLTATPPV